MKKIGYFLLLHLTLFVYALSSVASKFASGYGMNSLEFWGFYGVKIGILGIYALLWQKVLRHFQLTTAFANKSITIIWSLVLGALIFHEPVSLRQALACVVIIIGMVVCIYDK